MTDNLFFICYRMIYEIDIFVPEIYLQRPSYLNAILPICSRAETHRWSYQNLTCLTVEKATVCHDKLECFTHQKIKLRKKLAIHDSSTTVVINAMNLPCRALFFYQTCEVTHLITVPFTLKTTVSASPILVPIMPPALRH